MNAVPWSYAADIKIKSGFEWIVAVDDFLYNIFLRILQMNLPAWFSQGHPSPDHPASAGALKNLLLLRKSP